MEEATEAVQQMQDYITAHLTETITPADLARASCFSPFYAHRLFVHHVGLTPADYIRWRLSRPALRLRDEPCRVIDVALELGFGSVDGYQRAFFGSLAAISRSMRATPCPSICLLPTASNIGQGEGRTKWNRSDMYLFNVH